MGNKLQGWDIFLLQNHERRKNKIEQFIILIIPGGEGGDPL
jgi:hypothetical protein